MCLTEPQAGSDVGALRTRAARDGDRYRIFGTKIFITCGEHDLAENIVHLVLARLDGAPAGTRGISLFIVPKFLPDADGAPGRATTCAASRSSTSWASTRARPASWPMATTKAPIGFLLGEENQGMRCMFTMMNNARLAVGHQGLGIAERAYQQALAYARERVQGRRGGSPAPIVELSRRAAHAADDAGADRRHARACPTGPRLRRPQPAPPRPSRARASPPTASPC